MVGIFAGRGDIVLAMGLALIVGMWLGYQLRAAVERLKAWRQGRRSAASTTP